MGKAVGVDLSAGVNMSNINGRSTTTDQIAAAAGHKIQQFRDSATEQADAAHLSGRDREFINQNVALQSEAFYRPLLKAAQETAEAHSTGSIVSDISTPQTTQPTPEKSEWLHAGRYQQPAGIGRAKAGGDETGPAAPRRVWAQAPGEAPPGSTRRG